MWLLGQHIFTVTLRDRRATYFVDAITDLRAAFRVAKQQQSFEIIAIAVMPEHLHAVIRMADDDADYAKLWRTVKGNFTQRFSENRGHVYLLHLIAAPYYFLFISLSIRLFHYYLRPAHSFKITR